MNQTNMIPGIYAAGQFEAVIPFDQIVDAERYYTVEAIRTVAEMQSRNLDIYSLVLQPAGIPKDETTKYIDEFLTNKAVIIVLTLPGDTPVYIPSTYLSSFPAIDGVVLEHLCILADCGAVTPTIKTLLDETLNEVSQVIEKSLGVKNTVRFGVIPTKSYLSKTQADAWEQSRQLAINGTTNTIIENQQLKDENAELKAYITKLETAVKAK